MFEVCTEMHRWPQPAHLGCQKKVQIFSRFPAAIDDPKDDGGACISGSAPPPWPAPSNCTSQSFAHFHFPWQKFLLTITNFYFLLLKCDPLPQIAQAKVLLTFTFHDKNCTNQSFSCLHFPRQKGPKCKACDKAWRWDLETSNVHKNGVVSRSIVVSYGYKSSLQGQ